MEPLRKKVEFAKTYRLGKSVRTPNFTIKALQVKTETIKLGIVVSKKVSKKAVVRNRARRRVREIIRKNISLAIPGFFVIVNIYTDLSILSHADLEKEIIRSLQSLKVFKNE